MKKGGLIVGPYYYPRLRQCREESGLTQSQVAKMLHLTEEKYAAFETGKEDIFVNYLPPLSLLYQTSIDYLLGRTNNPAPP